MKKSLHLVLSGFALGLFLFGLSAQAQVKGQKDGTPFTIGQTATAITIDGTVDAAWDGIASYVAVDPTTWTPNPDLKNLDDASFTWSGLWDNTNLYLLVRLRDDVVTIGDTAGGSAAKNWMNDNIEMVLNDPAGAKAPYKYRFSYDRDNDPLVANNGPSGFTFATKSVSGGWVLEVAIPWAGLTNDSIDFSAYPAIDKMLSMNLVMADLDNPAGNSWDQLSGHIQWPKGWSATDVVLAATAPVDNTSPAVVTGLTTTNLTFSSVTLGWNAAGAGDAMGYLLVKNNAPLKYIDNPATTSIDITGLSPESNYNLQVFAVDAQGISAPSAAATITTLAKPTLKSIDLPRYTGSKANPFEDLDAWEAAPSNAISYVVGGTVADEADLSASFKVMWTSSNLYIQTNIVDQERDNSKFATAWWETDNVEYHFDMGNQRDGASCESVDPDTYDQDNFQYRAIVGKGELQTCSTPAPKWDGIQQATYDLYDGSGTTVIGYTIEVNFPWATLNSTSGLSFVPANGAKFAIDFKVSDTDPVAGQPWSSVGWSTYEFGGQNRNDSQFGQMTITGATAINDNRSLMLNVYPNPAQDFVAISLEKASNGSVSLVDMTGKMIQSRTLDNEQFIRMDVRGISSGIYFITISENNQVYRSKLVIQ